MTTPTAQPWKPTTIRRFVKAINSSACTARVLTDAGPAYLKALGSSEGPHTLACEWVGTNLAKWFGLPTFDFSIIEVAPEDEIPFYKVGAARPGPAFVTRAESGEPWSGKKNQLKRLFNPQDISRLVVFDTWTVNCDRHGPPAPGKMKKPRVNRNNVFLSEEAPAGQFMLKAMDHTHCFTCGRDLSRQLKIIDAIRDQRVFGLFPEFRLFLDRVQIEQAAKDLRSLDKATVVPFVHGIPREWSVTSEAQNALIDFIVDRAAFVAGTIVDALFPQGELDFDGSNSENGP